VTAPDDFPEPRPSPSLDDPAVADDLLARLRARAGATGTDTEPQALPPLPAPPSLPMPPPAPHQPTSAMPPADAAAANPTVTPAGSVPAFTPVAGGDDGHDGDGGADDDEGDGEPEDKKSKRTRSIIEWIAVAVGALVVAFLIRAFLLQAFYIPSESMEPTLYKQDRILVNKLSYKLHAVHRGDLVVFEKPPGETNAGINDLIKRVIALPNETIEQRGDQIFIDGKLLSEPYLRDGQAEGVAITWVDGCANPASERTKCTIPAGHVWVMGDNRDHSHDSRFFGPITEKSIVGRAFLKVWPLDKIGFL
jgi:signal peptidase I